MSLGKQHVLEAVKFLADEAPRDGDQAIRILRSEGTRFEALLNASIIDILSVLTIEDLIKISEMTK